MSIYKDGKLIAGGRQCMPLLSFMWADHVLNDVSWLRADTFSWQSGAVYQAAYQHLVEDLGSTEQTHYYAWYDSEDDLLWYTLTETPAANDPLFNYYDGTIHPVNPEGEQISSYDSSSTPPSIRVWTLGDSYWADRDTSKDIIEQSGGTASAVQQTETINGYTIVYWLAEDGHKIVLSDQESVVEQIYNATGVAWYYIIDTTNQRFKLPRTKFGFTGLRDAAGKYVAPGLPNITGTLATARQTNAGVVQDASGAFTGEYPVGTSDGTYYGTSASYRVRYTFNAHNSDSIYGNSTTVQPPATQMYLYFYVGNFTQTALENTAGITTEEMNNKVNIGHEVIEFQAPTAENNYTWYRKYADGWVEQGGQKTGSSSTYVTITLPVTMANTGYFVAGHPFEGSNTSAASVVAKPLNTRTTTTVQFIACYQGTFWSGIFCWEVKGMAA